MAENDGMVWHEYPLLHFLIICWYIESISSAHKLLQLMVEGRAMRSETAGVVQFNYPSYLRAVKQA